MLAVIFRSEIATQFQESSKMFQIKTKTGRKQKRNEKRARGNEFPRTLMGVMIQGQCACFAGDKLKVPKDNPFQLEGL